MKKIIPLLILPFLFACSSDDDTQKGEISIISKGSTFHGTSKNENGKYQNVFYATVVNTTSAPIKGHVRFEIKDYGYINSTSETVTNEKGFQNTYGAELETDKIIDESYLLKAEFVRE